MYLIEIERTKSSLPALWECGGGYSHTGFAQLIADPAGNPMKPVYIRGRGSLANSDHALFVVHEGDTVLVANQHRKDYEIVLYKIVSISENEAELETLYTFSEGEWDSQPPSSFELLLEAGEDKAVCYHCREPHFYSE